MNRPEVRIVEFQKEEISPAHISQTEKEALLYKYGFSNLKEPDSNSYEVRDNGLTFEEMCRAEEKRLADQRMREYQKRIGPKPITFGGEYYSNVNFEQDTDSGLSFKISIVSDMKLPK
jgi:hypothetical protein